MYIIIGVMSDRDPIARGPFDDEDQAFLAAARMVDVAAANNMAVDFTIAELKEPKE